MKKPEPWHATPEGRRKVAEFCRETLRKLQQGGPKLPDGL